MKATILLLTLSLAGCQTCQRHPVACTASVFAAGVIVQGLAKSRNYTSVKGGDVTIPGLDCSKVSCQ